MEVPLWAALLCLAAGLIILGITFFPGQRTRLREPSVPAEPETWEVCRQTCRDPLCQRFGCPSDPDWKGDRR